MSLDVNVVAQAIKDVPAINGRSRSVVGLVTKPVRKLFQAVRILFQPVRILFQAVRILF